MKAKKTVECCLGCQTTEATARRLEALLPTLPAEARTLRRKSVISPDTQVEADSRTETSYVSTVAMDRAREIVVPEGVDLTDYRLNPVVLFEHDPTKLVGKCQWIKADEKGLIAKSQYIKRPNDYEGEWLPDFVWAMIVADVLRGKSIGFLPTEIRDPEPEEIEANPVLERVITKSLLLEFSAVSIPSNPIALIEQVNRGLDLSIWKFKAIPQPTKKAAPQPKPKKRPVEQPKQLSAEQIAELAVKHILDRWQV